MEFHKTRRGQKFFDSDFPDMIRAIEKLTEQVKTLNESQTKMQKIKEMHLKLQIKESRSRIQLINEQRQQLLNEQKETTAKKD